MTEMTSVGQDLSLQEKLNAVAKELQPILDELLDEIEESK